MSTCKPVVSIVMPVYNGESFITESIRSVIQQSFQDWELIVVDDASADTSVGLVQALCAVDERIRLLQLEQNSGAAVARNTAIEHARGRYIAFLDGDDLWLPHKLELQLAFMYETRAAFSYSAYDRIDEAGRRITTIGVPKIVQYQDLLKTNYIGSSTAIYDTSLVGKVFMPTNTKREDLATWLVVLKVNGQARGLNRILSQYRVYSRQSSRNKASMAKENWKLYRDVEALNLFQSAFYFCHYAVKGLFRSRFPKFALKLGMLHKVQER
jgi:teichuronic acid biosynthesis glycosyltransferase TuaG